MPLKNTFPNHLKTFKFLLFAIPRTVTYQSPPSMEFSRQEYRSGLPFPTRGDLSDPRIKPGSPTLQADALPSEPAGKPQTKTLFPNQWSLIPIKAHLWRSWEGLGKRDSDREAVRTGERGKHNPRIFLKHILCFHPSCPVRQQFRPLFSQIFSLGFNSTSLPISSV